MSDGKSISLAAILVTIAAVCGVLSMGLCGTIFSHAPSKIVGIAFIGGLGLLALAVVLAVAAFIAALWQGPR